MRNHFILLGFFALTPALAFAATSSFVPLTALPGLQSVAASTNLSGLFNNLYKLCIGAAATIAVLEIVWAGIMYMSAGDNSEQVGQARGKIQNALLGLLLVLSPYIVFSIINPSILSLQINGIGSLTSGNTANTSATVTTSANGATSQGIWVCTTQAICTAAGGTPSAICFNSSNNTATAWNGKTCSSGYSASYVACTVQGSGCVQAQQSLTAATTVSCPVYTANQAITPGCESGCVAPNFKVQVGITGKGGETCVPANTATANACQTFPSGVTQVIGVDTANQACCSAQTGCTLTGPNAKTGSYICSCN